MAHRVVAIACGLLGLRRDGVISDDVYEELTADVDAALEGEHGADERAPTPAATNHTSENPGTSSSAHRP